MSVDFYKNNQRYSETLRDSDPRRFQTAPRLCASQSFYHKYARALCQRAQSGAAILDVGCGVGQVVRDLASWGFAASGIDVSQTSIAMAQEHSATCQVYDGKTIPFPDQTFEAVGAFNVLEHVEEPVAFLDEMNRVLRSGGTMLISSPNFMRVIGYRDYHPHMQGVSRKLDNLQILRQHAREYARNPDRVLFEKLTPIIRDEPRPDDDAIVATNALDIRQYFRTRKFTGISVSCVDRPVPRMLEIILDATPFRFVMLNSFVVGQKA
jgi:2-polyprenyl-3-methyl-5-hydroxy-6-metoxy-1,4-benzoquinol methylase